MKSLNYEKNKNKIKKERRKKKRKKKERKKEIRKCTYLRIINNCIHSNLL
jgi:hypothetical protein